MLVFWLDIFDQAIIVYMIDSELRVNVCRFVRKTFYTFYIQTAEKRAQARKKAFANV